MSSCPLQIIFVLAMKSSHKLFAESNKRNQESSEFNVQDNSNSSSSFSNGECVRQEKIQKLRKKKKRIYNTKSKGNWEIDEDVRFMNFMVQNRRLFEVREFRRSAKIFKRMAKFVSSRCPEQCRSHHQKYEKKYGSFDGIVEFITNKSNQLKQVKQIKAQQIKKKEQQENQQLFIGVQNKKQRAQKMKKRKIEQFVKGEEPRLTQAPLKFQEIQKNLQYKMLLRKVRQKHLEIKILLNFETVGSYAFGL